MHSRSSVFVDSQGLTLVATGVGAFSHVQDSALLASGRVLWVCIGRLGSWDLGHLRHHIILDSKHLVVEESSMVLRNGFGGVVWLFVGDCGRSKELTEFVSIKSAHFQFSLFGKELLQVIVGDLLLVDVSHLQSSLGRSESLLLREELLFLSVAADFESSLTSFFRDSQGFSWSLGESASFSSELSSSSSSESGAGSSSNLSLSIHEYMSVWSLHTLCPK